MSGLSHHTRELRPLGRKYPPTAAIGGARGAHEAHPRTGVISPWPWTGRRLSRHAAHRGLRVASFYSMLRPNRSAATASRSAPTSLLAQGPDALVSHVEKNSDQRRDSTPDGGYI